MKERIELNRLKMEVLKELYSIGLVKKEEYSEQLMLLLCVIEDAIKKTNEEYEENEKVFESNTPSEDDIENWSKELKKDIYHKLKLI